MEPNDDIVEVPASSTPINLPATDPMLIAILSAMQQTMAENTNLILDVTASLHQAPVTSQEAQHSASEEANPPASEEAQHAASEKAQQSSNRDSALSLFGDNDLEEESDRFLDLIDDSPRPSDGFGPPISENCERKIQHRFGYR
jgi:uncharacterized protein involved in copper resistance